MSDITLSSAVRSNLLSLQGTADLMAKTQERLSTGLKVNSALDNPTNFFTASSLNSRAGDLGRLLDGVANATQTLEAADNGISAITDLVESAQASARQALQARGQETTSSVTGNSSATFNPQSLTSIAGDNTGTGALTADAAATVASGSIAADADITFTTGDLDANAADGAGALSDAGADGPGLTAGESLTLNVDGTNYTLTFDAATGAGAARTGSAGAGYNVTIGVDQTVADLTGAFNDLLAGSGVTAAGTDNLTFTSTSAVDSVALSDGAADGSTLTKVGLNGVGSDRTSTGGDTGDRLITRNADLQALAAAGNTSTLSIGLGGTNLGTVTIGTGSGEVSNKEDLTTALNNLNGVSASSTAGAPGAITLATSDTTDADSAITVTGNSNATLQTAFGYTPDTAGGTVATAAATNLLSQSAVTAGQTLSIQVGNSTQLDVTFGNGTGQVSTLAELNESLRSLSGGSASVDARGELNITADSAGDTVTIGGDDAALTAFGVSAGESSTLIDGTNIADGDSISVQVGTNTALNITFGTGTNQVNTIEELETALGNLAGGKASIDDQTGAISIEATNGSDSITIGATDASAGGGEANILGSFGLSAGVTTSVTNDSTQRQELETQYNELLSQIDELAEDAGFNGVNLLDGDNLKVIFNEDGSSELDIDGETFNSAGLGLSRVSSGYFQSDNNIEATLDTLDTTIQTLRSQASKFGSNLSIVETREDFTKNMINTLETGAANLTLADTNEEGANLTALQTRQQLSTTSLSLATQADQNVLRLF
jgi:hypothetical protein